MITRLLLALIISVSAVVYGESVRADDTNFQAFTYDSRTGRTTSTYGWTDGQDDTIINQFDPETGEHRFTIIYRDEDDDEDDNALGEGLW